MAEAQRDRCRTGADWRELSDVVFINSPGCCESTLKEPHVRGLARALTGAVAEGGKEPRPPQPPHK